MTKKNKMIRYRITVIGAGNMGSAIIKGIGRRHKITASDKDKGKLKRLSIRRSASSNNREGFVGADVIIIAVKPRHISAVMDELAGVVKKGQLVVSVAAGITTSMIEKKLGRVPVIRVMPNTPLMVGQGMSVICPGRYAKPKQIRIAEALFALMGEIITIKDEKLMDTVTAISGSGPAYMYLFIEALTESAKKLGLSHKAACLLVAQTLAGAVALLQTSGKTPEFLRRQVTSPGGTTEAALKVFHKKKFHKIVHQAVKSAQRRSRQLSRG